MEINFNSGVNWSNVDAHKVEGQAANATESAAKGAKVSTGASLNVRSSSVDVLKGSEPTAEVPESTLTRDDDLGKLLSSAFNLAPPPMPNFS